MEAAGGSTERTFALLPVEELVVDRPFLPCHALLVAGSSPKTKDTDLVLSLLRCALAAIVALVSIVWLFEGDRPAAIAAMRPSSAPPRLDKQVGSRR